MRRSLLLLLGLVAAGVSFSSGSNSTAAELQRVIPERFRGEWQDSRHPCGSPINMETRLLLQAGTVTFYESGGPAVAVVTSGTSELALITALAGEGQTWLDLRRFLLSADQSTLTDVTHAGGPDQDKPFVRKRCPPQR
ncbi:hypothetical protein KBZ18_09240 [Synechococcus sp. Cruz-9H2]|uniref:hypothetical protein n=1 Tax=unclassified Synechococcus TaxID=2626047 RepID=UPI0020CC547A|nr:MULTISPECIES: hypothetical protein [unclassified Synechococcus]MCP9819676.1 hypothetical protein [Synechococcus sp. Cruz-9H2]MCP9843981.1 hypothetical protein [Synechococcus sp. Edmonson 11F2]MCP9856106.1 hypothetical protein [Synechococcus sp. Cruz-9C9]MCP9863390.1 hypothetical protein [Synechococcus sp. Cruz-7E5]MCP9870583.1 hypothetical protein [Synechococcus sp. Cruz-7B9]